MPGELMVRNLGQVLLQLLDHDLGHGLAQGVLDLPKHARRRHEDKLIELPLRMQGRKLGRDGADEILFRGVVQIAARLARVTRRRCALLDPRRTIAPSSSDRLCNSVETKLESVLNAPEASRSTNAPAHHRR